MFPRFLARFPSFFSSFPLLLVLLFVTGSARAAAPSYYVINCGGGASGSYAADGYASGGTKYTTAHAIDTSGVQDAAPQDVYQSERYGMSFT